jgi:uncharacterized membrane protein YphA (DoxX/SURF4 family)
MYAVSFLTADRARAALPWVLRIGASCCFVGHGVFGLMRKPAWIPYFGVAGIGPENAHALMPVVGAIDIAMGLLVLARPYPLVLAWMTTWAIWTALLRPLAGESPWEAIERAGNFGAPLALLFLVWSRYRATDSNQSRIRVVVTVCTVMLLVGHGALGLLGKSSHVANYAALFGVTSALRITRIAGSVEIAAAIWLAVRQSVPLAVGIVVWKLLTESLYLLAGAPVWEVIERGGSYALPVALALILFVNKPKWVRAHGD